MEMNNLFINAARKQYRYPFNGLISTEDLFQLKPEQLDKVYKSLMKQVKKAEDDSLMDTQSKEDKETIEKVEIVKYIFDYKKVQAEKVRAAQETRQKNQRIMDLIAQKKDEKLQSLSVEELTAMLVSEETED